jgi:hypothetical protein
LQDFEIDGEWIVEGTEGGIVFRGSISLALQKFTVIGYLESFGLRAFLDCSIQILQVRWAELVFRDR